MIFKEFCVLKYNIMKIRCTCDNIIVDQTDYLKNKGYIISDTQWFDFWDTIDDAIEKSNLTKKENKKGNESIQLSLQNIFRNVWECTNCGKLYVEGKDSELIVYTPDLSKYNEILNRKD